jgi:hypothetical protein
VTEDKDFKRVVRDRAAKTGESYSAARTQLAPERGAPTSEARESLARLLSDNTETVVHALCPPHASRQSVMSALIAAQAVADAIDKATRELVADARGAGHSWEEIAQMLGIRPRAAKRLAARAGPITGKRSPALERRTTEIVEQIRDADWDAVMADWDETMRAQLPIQRVAEVWQQVSSQGGSLQAFGRPSIVRSGLHRIVEVPLAFEHGPMKARIAFNNRDDSVAGLFILPPDAD